MGKWVYIEDDNRVLENSMTNQMKASLIISRILKNLSVDGIYNLATYV